MKIFVSIQVVNEPDYRGGSYPALEAYLHPTEEQAAKVADFVLPINGLNNLRKYRHYQMNVWTPSNSSSYKKWMESNLNWYTKVNQALQEVK